MSPNTNRKLPMAVMQKLGPKAPLPANEEVEKILVDPSKKEALPSKMRGQGYLRRNCTTKNRILKLIM